MAKILLSIITPIALYHEVECDMVVVPSSKGEMGIMPGHIPSSLILKEGEIKIYNNDNLEKSVKIESGFVEFLEDKCKVLTEKAEG